MFDDLEGRLICICLRLFTCISISTRSLCKTKSVLPCKRIPLFNPMRKNSAFLKVFFFFKVIFHEDLTRQSTASFPYVMLHCWSALYIFPGNAAFRPELSGTFFKQSLGIE